MLLTAETVVATVTGDTRSIARLALQKLLVLVVTVWTICVR